MRPRVVWDRFDVGRLRVAFANEEREYPTRMRVLERVVRRLCHGSLRDNRP